MGKKFPKTIPPSRGLARSQAGLTAETGNGNNVCNQIPEWIEKSTSTNPSMTHAPSPFLHPVFLKPKSVVPLIHAIIRSKLAKAPLKRGAHRRHLIFPQPSAVYQGIW